MADSRMSEAIQKLRSVALLCDGAEPTDGQLLEAFLSRRDAVALTAIVSRHAPMVWGVCRRILRNDHDAEDAFQAAFLVLVRRAASIASRDLLANWLYAVACQTARKARSTAARRRTREKQVAQMPEPSVDPRESQLDLRSLLDQELSSLGDKYRALVVLCDLEGKTRAEAARELGCPEGTVAGRLARAREMLAKRLARRGVMLSGAALAASVAQEGAASAPAAVLSATIKAACLVAAEPAAISAAVSPAVAALTEGVLQSMFVSRLKTLAIIIVAVGLLAGSAGWIGLELVARDPPNPDGLVQAEQEKKKASPEAENVPFVDQWKDSHSTERNKQRLVIRKADEFAKVWQTTQAGRKPALEPPKVDFTKHLVLALFMGERNTGGYDIAVTKVERLDKELRVYVKETAPGPKDVVDTVITHPFHIVVVPRVEGKVVFIEGQPGGKDARKAQGKVVPPDAPLVVVLKANKDTYKLDLGGRSTEQFRKFAEGSTDFGAGGPPTPVVDLVLEVRNISDKPIQLFTLPDLAKIVLELAGPDALTIRHEGPIDLDRRLPKPITLQPGQVFTRPIRNLDHGARDGEFRSFWVAPGEYTLTAEFQTAILPAPRGALVYGGGLGEPQLKGFGEVTVTTPPLKLKVTDGKDAKKPVDKKALDAIQGDWRFAKVDVKNEGPAGELKEQLEDMGKLIVKGDKVTVIFDIAHLGEEMKEVWLADFTILKVDLTKNPPTVDLRLDKRTPVWSPKDDPDANKPRNVDGIFSLEGGTLKLYFGEDEKERPKAFPQKEKQGVLTLTRGKAQKGKEEKPPQGQLIRPTKNLITGYVDGEEEAKLSPPNGFITKKEDFEKLWKVWLLGDKVPAVDFRTHLVVVATSKEGPITTVALFDEKNAGDMRIRIELDRKTKIDASNIAVLIAVFPRAGLKSIEGRAVAGP